MPTTADRRPALAAFAEAIRESPHNLVSSRAAAELETRHIPECVALAELLPEGLTEILDVDSGGGLPGLVIAICRPDAEVHLIESTGKKADFLREVSQRLGLRTVVHNDRMEALHEGELAGRFEAVTARAVAPLERLIPWTVPFLSRTGALYAVKGERWRDEVVAAAQAFRRTATTVRGVQTAPLAAVGDAAEARLRVVIVARAGDDRPAGEDVH